MAPPARTSAPLWLKVLVIVMGLVIVTGFILVATETIRRLSTSGGVQSPAGTPFAQRIALPSGAQVLSMTAVGDRLVVHVEGPDGLPTAYIVDPRTGALLGTITFPPGTAR
ncbi:MAG: hypothetical protein JSR90_10345 [Proteobacteria bacterium]|nr:hypothetical protein [Pseudomonadota bacterium]